MAMLKVATLLTPRASRMPVTVKTRFVCGGAPVDVTVINVTVYGFMAEAEREVRAGEAGILCLPWGEELKAEVRWAQGTRFGAEFVPAIRTFTLAQILSLYETDAR